MSTEQLRLAREWLQAKTEENAAKLKRLGIEEQLISCIGCKPEGAETHTFGNLKLTITGKLTRTVDEAAWREVADLIPEDMRPVRVVEKIEPDAAGCRWLQQNKPELWALAARAITTKPAKPGVEIKEVR
jgi:hypothetical protein